MKLLFIDPFEAINPNVSLYLGSGGNPVRDFLPNVFGTGDGGIAALNKWRTGAGVVSKVRIYNALASVSDFPTYSLAFGPAMDLSEGKVCFGAAISAELEKVSSGTVRILGLRCDNADQLVTMAADGTVAFLGNSGATSVTTSATFFLEVVLDIDAGTYEVYVDDASIMSGTHSFATITTQMVGHTSGSGTALIYLDDMYILGGTDGPFSDRLGPVRAIRAPLDATAEANFSPFAAATNLDAVNKTDLSTATYNRSPALNDKQDRFTLDLSDVPNDKPIIAVAQSLYYRKTDVGARGLESVISGPSGANADKISLPSRVVTFGGHPQHIVTEKPGGGSLDFSALEDMEFGYEVTE